MTSVNTNQELYNHIKDNSIFVSDLKNNYMLQIIVPNDSQIMQLFVDCGVDFKKSHDVDKGEFILEYTGKNIINLLSPILFSLMNASDNIIPGNELINMYIKILIQYEDKKTAKYVLYYYYKSRYNFLKDDGETSAFRLITYNNEQKIIKSLLDYCTSIPYEEVYNSVLKRTEFNYTNDNVINIASFLLDDTYKNKDIVMNDQLMQEYLILLYNRGVYKKVLNCTFDKTDVRVVTPIKKYASSSGYDLSIIKEVTKIGKNMATFDTGLKVNPPTGYYFEIIQNNDLTSNNIKMNNPISIIDCQCCDSIKITLSTIDGKPLNVQLPMVCGKLILKKHYHFVFVEDK